MPQRISILPETLTNKIAAGEVVERPASVIKELVENALDAGATDITVEIESGGRRLIRITDNGHGMSREDALLSLERHATSKIKNDGDLDAILTLGFRGEALPSIASVSRFRLATRETGSLEGTEIVVEGGRVRDVKACGMAPGTVVSVEQLFFNLPARLKFLRNADTEAGHVGDTIVRMAISRPDVSFTCLSDGREMVRVQRSELRRRLSQVLGRKVAADLYDVNSSRDGMSISGFISSPAGARSTTSAMFTYVNGRFVRDRIIQHAIMQAFRGVTDRGRYPVVALFMEVPPGEVDVNVHPSKHEVRFRRQAAVHDALQAALEEVLSSSPWLTLPDKAGVPLDSSSGQAYRERIAAAAQTSLALPVHRAASAPVYPSADKAPVIKDPCPSFQAATEPSGHTYFSSLAVIGQFHGEYILCQSGPELVIIDQHAASERVAFQRLRRQCLDSGVESQHLLFPETLELSFAEADTARRFQAELRQMGYEIEPFGGNTVILTAVPQIITDGGGTNLLRDMLGEMAQIGASGAFREKQDELLARIACHSVVRGFHHLEHRQIVELLASMDETEFAASCPHGRPVSHIITLAELEKIFKRT